MDGKICSLITNKIMKLVKKLDYETFENIIVSATESGSFWQYFVKDFCILTDRYLTQNVNDIAKFLWNDESSELRVRTSGKEYIVTYDSVRENMQLAYENYEKYEYHINQFLKGQGDSTNADVIFQVLVMGEVKYG